MTSQVALNRGHARVGSDDLDQAARSYSEDMLLALGYEIGDVDAQVGDAIYSFHGHPSELRPDELRQLLTTAGLGDPDISGATTLLVWFGFLGVRKADEGVPRFAYNVRYNLRQLEAAIETGNASFVVHPAFRPALGMT